nr:8194_t:CDS:2 [Entrophospora candida]
MKDKGWSDKGRRVYLETKVSRWCQTFFGLMKNGRLTQTLSSEITINSSRLLLEIRTYGEQAVDIKLRAKRSSGGVGQMWITKLDMLCSTLCATLLEDTGDMQSKRQEGKYTYKYDDLLRCI